MVPWQVSIPSLEEELNYKNTKFIITTFKASTYLNVLPYTLYLSMKCKTMFNSK